MTLHAPGLPDSVSIVQLLPSLQVAGQLPSQFSPGSMTPFPQYGEQSLSLPLVHPDGQHPSPPAHWVMLW